MTQRTTTITTGIVAIVVLVVVTGLMDWNLGMEIGCSPKPSPSSSSQGVAFQPIVITGSGGKTTAPFLITTAEWIIDWSYVPDGDYPVFGAFIHRRSDDAVYQGITASKKETSGSTYCYAGPGEYYLEIHVMNIKNWEITIRPA